MQELLDELHEEVDRHPNLRKFYLERPDLRSADNPHLEKRLFEYFDAYHQRRNFSVITDLFKGY